MTRSTVKNQRCSVTLVNIPKPEMKTLIDNDLTDMLHRCLIVRQIGNLKLRMKMQWCLLQLQFDSLIIATEYGFFWLTGKYSAFLCFTLSHISQQCGWCLDSNRASWIATEMDYMLMLYSLDNSSNMKRYIFQREGLLSFYNSTIVL